MSRDLQIKEGEGGISRGDFGATVEGSRLSLPAALVSALKQAGVFSAQQMLTFARDLPSGLAELFDWRLDEVRRATNRLEILLRAHLPGGTLRAHHGKSRGMGARTPLPRGGVRGAAKPSS